jgi:hypothetical protein
MSTFSVQASIANPDLLERRLGVELVVDTGATYTLLPAEVVRHLDRERSSRLSGPLIGAVTLEQFALAADPVHQRLVPVPRVLL